MGIIERQKLGKNSDSKCVSFRLPVGLYLDMCEYAYSKRYSIAALATMLLTRALNAENGNDYVPIETTGTTDRYAS